MAEIVTLRGVEIAAASDPDHDLVNTLEHLLASAMSGRLRGIAFVTMSADDALGTGWIGDADNRMLLSGAATLQYRIAQQLDEG